MLKAIFFDLDGTLLDTIDDIREALNAALKASKLDLSYERKDVLNFIGKGTDYLIHASLGQFDNEENFKILKKNYLPLYEECQKHKTHPFSGCKESLEYLQTKYMLFVCTNKPDNLAKQVIAKVLPTIHFKSVDGQKEGVAPKPNPAILLNDMKEYNLKPEECLMIGDSYPDALTGKNADMRVGLCLYGYGKYDEELLSLAYCTFDSPSDWMKL